MNNIFTDGSGHWSGMRVAMFVMILAGILLIFADAFGYSTKPTDFDTLLLLFGGGLGGKIVQKFKEVN